MHSFCFIEITAVKSIVIVNANLPDLKLISFLWLYIENIWEFGEYESKVFGDSSQALFQRQSKLFSDERYR